MLVDAGLQHWEERLFAMFETQRLIVLVGGIDGANDNPPLMAKILPCDTSTFVGALTMLALCIKWTWKFCLTRQTPSAIKDEL